MGANPNANAQMFYTRRSDGLAYCFSPVPTLAESVESLQTIIDGTQTRYGTRHRLTFNGTLLPQLPAMSGVDPDATCLELLDRKSDQLKAALDEDRGNLLIVDSSGYAALSVTPRVVSLDFPDSQIVQKRDYTIVFEYDTSIEDNVKISDYNESWDFSYQDDDTISVSHSISAVGINNLPAGTGAIQNAKYFVLQRASSLDTSKATFHTSPFVQSIVDIQNLVEYNHTRSETLDESAGQYSIQEGWTMASGAYKDDRTIESSFSLDEFGDLIETLVVNGTVNGYGDTTFDRYDNAVDAFENVVIDEIGFNAASGITSKTRSDNRYAGTVTYSVTFDSSSTDPLEGRAISRSFQRNDDGTVSQTVTTSCQVKTTSDSTIDEAINYCFVNNYPIDNYVEPYFSASLSGNLESVSSERDDVRKSFSLTRVFREQGVPLYREEWQVNREQNIENAITVISVAGTVFGLGVESGTDTNVRFANASGAFYNTIQPLIYSRAEELVVDGSCIGDSEISSSVGWNKLNGIITYDYKYDNRFSTNNGNIRDEKVDVQYTLQSDVVVEIPIPGKADGPILQDQETKTALQKSLKIQYAMKPSGITCGPIDTTTQRQLENEALTESNILVNNTLSEHSRGEKPSAIGVFKTGDTYSFNRQTQVFTRNVTWKYTAT